MSQEEKMAMSYGTSFTCRKTVIHLCLSSILQGSDPVRPPPPTLIKEFSFTGMAGERE